MKNPVTAQRLRQAMDEMNMKAVELSERSGLGKSSISQYLNGSHSPSNISSGRMGKVLKVNPLWLMGFDVSKYPDTSEAGVQTFVHPEAYYENEDARRIAQQVFDDPNLRVLFDAASNASPEDILTAADLLRKFKNARRD